MTSTAKEYAAALFILAKEQQQTAAFLDALRTVEALFAAQPAYVELLRSPGVPQAERLALLNDAFADTLPKEVFALLRLLCKSGQMRAFADCVAAYNDMLEDARRVSSGQVTSAAPLTDAEKTALATRIEALCGHRVSLQYATDPALLGGVTVAIDGKIIDGSLKRRLREVKEVIAK